MVPPGPTGQCQYVVPRRPRSSLRRLRAVVGRCRPARRQRRAVAADVNHQQRRRRHGGRSRARRGELADGRRLQRLGRQPLFGPGGQQGGQRHQRHRAQPRRRLPDRRQHRHRRRGRPDPHGPGARHDGLGQRGRLRRQHLPRYQRPAVVGAERGLLPERRPLRVAGPARRGRPDPLHAVTGHRPSRRDTDADRQHVVAVPEQQWPAQRHVRALHRLRLRDPGGQCDRGVAERSAGCRQCDEVDQQLMDDVGPPECRRRWYSDQREQCAGYRLLQRALRLQPPPVGQWR